MKAPTPGLEGGTPADWAAALKRSSFGSAALLLDAQARADLGLFYAYCRAIDDCADEFGPREGSAHLAAWDAELKRLERGRPDSVLGRGLGGLCARRRVPVGLLRDLWKGARSDVKPKVRFKTWDLLRDYCYHVAGSVGLVCLPIFGVDLEQGRAYGVALGEAFQLINILRDAREDAERGRLYFAQEDLRRRGLGEAEFMAGRGGDRARGLLEDYAGRARDALARADAGAVGLPPKGLRPSRLMRAVYGGLLDSMDSGGFKVFGRRYALPGWRKRWLAVKALLLP